MTTGTELQDAARGLGEPWWQLLSYALVPLTYLLLTWQKNQHLAVYQHPSYQRDNLEVAMKSEVEGYGKELLMEHRQPWCELCVCVSGGIFLKAPLVGDRG